MSETYVPIDRIRECIRDVAAFGALGPRIEDGYSRPAWGPEECAAIEYIRTVGEEAGLMSFYDAVGNLYLTTPGAPAPTPASGPESGSPGGGSPAPGGGVTGGLPITRSAATSTPFPRAAPSTAPRVL